MGGARTVNIGDLVDATLMPLDERDLTPQAQRIVGQRFRWEATFIIDEGWPYAGQWRMKLSLDDFQRTGVYWVPLCDLTEITTAGTVLRPAAEDVSGTLSGAGDTGGKSQNRSRVTA
jgi:hypothetical protein